MAQGCEGFGTPINLLSWLARKRGCRKSGGTGTLLPGPLSMSPQTFPRLKVANKLNSEDRKMSEESSRKTRRTGFFYGSQLIQRRGVVSNDLKFSWRNCLRKSPGRPARRQNDATQGSEGLFCAGSLAEVRTGWSRFPSIPIRPDPLRRARSAAAAIAALARL